MSIMELTLAKCLGLLEFFQSKAPKHVSLLRGKRQINIKNPVFLLTVFSKNSCLCD